MKKVTSLLITAAATTSMLTPITVSAAAFTDVSASKYYAAPVAWAVQEKIASGTSASTFEPKQDCKRGQIVTFLYNAYGENESAPAASFSDVDAGAYYAKAINWAVEKKITGGKTSNEFAPEETCNRAQAVTFLWRLAGEPSALETAGFSDVPADAYYAEAVNWAVEKGITSGISRTQFGPNKTCKRSDIVTFMYRNAGSPAVDIPNEEKTVSTDASGFSQLVVDDANIRFEITGIDEKGTFGYTWKVNLKNKTNRKVMFTLEDVSINGVMCDPYWAKEVLPEKTAVEEIGWSDSNLKKNNISEVTQVDFTLRAYDTGDWNKVYSDKTYVVYPMGRSAAKNSSQKTKASDQVLVDNEACTMTVTGIDPDGEWGFTVNVKLENKTDKTLMFSASDVSINDIMCDPYWATTVAPGKSKNTEITWPVSTLQSKGISEVKTIELPVRVYDEDNYDKAFADGIYSIQV